MSSDVVMEFQNTLAEDAIKAAEAAKLTPAGRYRATVTKISGATVDKAYFDKDETQRNPLYGKYVWNIQWALGSKREGEVKDNKEASFTSLDNPLVYFMRATPSVVMNDKGKPVKESQAYGDIAGVVKDAVGHIPSDKEVHDWLLANPVELYIAQYEEGEKDGRSWSAGNRINSIKAVK